MAENKKQVGRGDLMSYYKFSTDCNGAAVFSPSMRSGQPNNRRNAITNNSVPMSIKDHELRKLVESEDTFKPYWFSMESLIPFSNRQKPVSLC